MKKKILYKILIFDGMKLIVNSAVFDRFILKLLTLLKFEKRIHQDI